MDLPSTFLAPGADEYEDPSSEHTPYTHMCPNCARDSTSRRERHRHAWRAWLAVWRPFKRLKNACRWFHTHRLALEQSDTPCNTGWRRQTSVLEMLNHRASELQEDIGLSSRAPNIVTCCCGHIEYTGDYPTAYVEYSAYRHSDNASMYGHSSGSDSAYSTEDDVDDEWYSIVYSSQQDGETEGGRSQGRDTERDDTTVAG